MFAKNLVQRLEANWEQIAALISEERERAKDLSTKLSLWLLERDESRFAAHFEALGRRRCQEGMPLHEVIQKLNIIKRAIRRYVSEQNYSLTPIEIYQELEVLRAMAGFFDFVIFRVAKGYEEALRESVPAQTPKVLPMPWQGAGVGLLG